MLMQQWADWPFTSKLAFPFAWWSDERYTFYHLQRVWVWVHRLWLGAEHWYVWERAEDQVLNPGGIMFYNSPVWACATIERDEFISSFVFCHEVFIKLHWADPSSICLDSQIPHFMSNSKVPCWEDYCILGCNTMQSGRHILMVV